VVAPPARPTGWIGAALGAALLAVGSLAFIWQQHRDLGALGKRLDAATHELSRARALAAAVSSAPPGQLGQQLPVPYGEVPLSGARMAALGALLGNLDRLGFAGTVRIASQAGAFCLTGNPAEGFGPAPPRCRRIAATSSAIRSMSR